VKISRPPGFRTRAISRRAVSMAGRVRGAVAQHGLKAIGFERHFRHVGALCVEVSAARLGAADFFGVEIDPASSGKSNSVRTKIAIATADVEDGGLELLLRVFLAFKAAPICQRNRHRSKMFAEEVGSVFHVGLR